MTRTSNPPISGILLGDQGDRSVELSDKLYLLRDLNGDGDSADAGERGVFFDETNASELGVETPTGNILNVTTASDRSVYAADGDTDTVYRLLDENGDGDANDAGEATVWFSQADNAAGFTLPTPNGVAEGDDGAIYVVNAGIRSRPADAIYRTEDLNGDGDANDAGEARLWLDLQTIVPTSSPFDLSFIGDTAYLIDPSGGDEDTIFAIRDADGSGDISPDEVTRFAEKSTSGAPIDFTAAADGDSIVLWQAFPTSQDTQSVVRLTDLDGSGSIDQPNETVEIWNTGMLPGVFDTFAGFSIAADGKGRIALTSNDSGAFGDNVYLLDDINGDGDYFDQGETNVIASRAFDDETLFRPRSVSFYEGEVQRSDTELAAGNHFSLFLDRDSNTVFATGENQFGQLGQGVTGFDVATPLAVSVPEDFDGKIVSVSAGLLHGSFLTEDGDVYVWGFGNSGRLGLGDEDPRLSATKIEGALDAEKVVIIDHGNGASYAITSTGALYGWGQNTTGQLGLGDEEERLTPTRIDIGGETVVALSAGTSHTLALTSSGTVYGFGANVDGQVGDPTQVEDDGDPVREILNPVLVQGLPDDIVAVTADTQTSYAVTSDGRVFGWGENSFGQLFVGTDNGDGTFEPTDDKVLTPIELTALPDGIIDVKGGARWAAALTEDGDVYLWGPNDVGPTGGLDGDPATQSDGTFYPVKLAGLGDVNIVEIQSGPNHVLAVADDGTVYSFGSNSDGRLGYPSDGSTYAPAIVTLDGDAVPYLLAADPSDNARDVAADTSLVLTYTEAVFVGAGSLRIINRDDPQDIQEIDVMDSALVRIDGRTITLTPPDYLDPDARYQIAIDAGAFVDASGQPTDLIAAGRTFNFATSDDALPDRLTLVGTNEVDLLRGVDGNDIAIGHAGNDRIIGNAGNDLLRGGSGDDVISGGDGSDLIFGGTGDDVIAGDSGNDTIQGNEGDDQLEGNEGDDDLRGGSGNDTVSGGAGSDRVVGNQGDDVLFGGGSSDDLRGGDGNDKISGDAGADIILGGNGNDTISGGADADVIRGNSGDDQIRGDDGNDDVRGGNGNDEVRGGEGDDLVFGDDGNDRLQGNAGDDHVAGGAGNDLISGGGGNDRLVGNDGDDRLEGGDGNDIFTGGEGSDIFVFDTSDGQNIITDFDAKHDTIRLADNSAYSFSYNSQSGDTVLTYGETSIVLRDAALTPDSVTRFATETLRLTGAEAGDFTGYSVSDAGDVDGDGRGDILVGAFSADPDGKASAGQTYLVFGAALEKAVAEFGIGTVDLGALAVGQGVRIAGADATDLSGLSVSSAGDVDGDGLSDVLVSAHFAARDGLPLAGEVSVLFGAALTEAGSPEGSGVLDLGELTPDQGVIVRGATGLTWTGWSVSEAGDLDGDGFADILIGAQGANGFTGQSTVVFGSAINVATDGVVDLADPAAGDSFVFRGIDPNDVSGFQVASAGDVDGDGIGDILIGAYGADRDDAQFVGETHLIFGSAIASAAQSGTEMNLADLAVDQGILITGFDADDNSGRSVAGAGDVDGDGHADIVINAWSADPFGKDRAGEAYLLFGDELAEAATDGTFAIADLTPERGVLITGAAEDDFTGWSVSSAGDVTGDGLDDILLGAYGGEPGGLVYMISGAALVAEKSGDGVLDLSELTPDQGVIINGITVTDDIGFQVSNAGDIDADGLADIVIGAPFANRGDGPGNTGQAYVVTAAALNEAMLYDGRIDLGETFWSEADALVF